MSYFEFPHTRTYDSDLGWLIKTVETVKNQVDSLELWKAVHEVEYKQLKSLYDQIITGNFPPSIANAFYEWMTRNALDLVGHLVKCVFFEISDSGYFIANIPEEWHDIIFSTTGLDISVSDVDYGHLVLSY